MMWTSELHINIMQSINQIIHCMVERKDDRNKWILTEVYGSPYTKERNMLQDELYNIEVVIQEPWLILGDFNAMLHMGDKSRGNKVRTPNDIAFRGFMDHMGGIKLYFISNNFTWDNDREGKWMIRKKKID